MLDFYEHRTICTVLEAMRKAYETRNFAGLLGLIEEAQNMADRMEAGLAQKNSLEEWDKDWRKKKAELKALEAELAAKKESK